jgi:hypothetical protein
MRVRVDYDGRFLKLYGWIDGPAIFAVPQKGRVEMMIAGGQLRVACYDKNGVERTMRVENGAA